MKKFTALILSLILSCSFTLALSEEDIELDRLNPTGETTVTMRVDNARDTYIVVIPSKVEIDPVTQYGYGTITLKSGWQLISVNGLDVRLTEAENGIGGGYSDSSSSITTSSYQNFKMKTSSGNTVSYAIKPSNFSGPMHNSGTHYVSGYGTTTHTQNYLNNLISVNKGGDNSNDKTCTLTFYVQTMPPAGVYTDTLTFSIVTR